METLEEDGMQTFTDYQTPVFSQLIVDYITNHPDVLEVTDFLVRLGLEPDHARNYLAWLNGESVVIREDPTPEWHPERKAIEPDRIIDPGENHKVFHTGMINLFLRKHNEQ
jgi:hypothetical protein